jgi:hypothetical protein
MTLGPVPTVIGVPTAFVAVLIGIIVPGVKPGSKTALSTYTVLPSGLTPMPAR